MSVEGTSSTLLRIVTPNPSIKGLDPALEAFSQELPLDLNELRKAAASTSLVPTKDITIPSRSGVSLNARVYTPPDTHSLPILIYSHGGGWVRGTLDSYNAICSRLSLLGLVVVSLEYRLAPENKFPGTLHDVVDCTKWILQNREKIRGNVGDNNDVVLIGGDSAGAHLSVATLLKILDEDGSLPSQIVGEVLVYPPTDGKMNSASWVAYGDKYKLTKKVATQMWDWHLQSPDDINNPFVSVKLSSPSLLSKLPPTIIITAELDPLRDEGEEFAQMLSSKGVDTSCVRVLSTFHGFFMHGISTRLPSFEPYSALALSIIGNWIQRFKK